jgi:hypothetical protein
MGQDADILPRCSYRSREESSILMSTRRYLRRGARPATPREPLGGKQRRNARFGNGSGIEFDIAETAAPDNVADLLCLPIAR